MLKNRQRAMYLLLTCAMSCFYVPAAAQEAGDETLPVRSSVDANGVDLISGMFRPAAMELSIGNGDNALGYSRTRSSNGKKWVSLVAITLEYVDGYDDAELTMSGSTRLFAGDNDRLEPDEPDGSYLVRNGASAEYHDRNGSVIYFVQSEIDNDLYLPDHIRQPNGEIVQYFHKQTNTSTTPGGFKGARVQSVKSNFGYQLKFTYATNSASGPSADWRRVTRATAINNAVDYCDPAADACGSFSRTWPYIDYSETPSGSNIYDTETDAAGQAVRYTRSGNKIIAIKYPSSPNDTVAIAYNNDDRVASVTRDGITTGYAWSETSTTLTATVTDAQNNVRVTTASKKRGTLLTDRNALNQTTTFQYDAKGKLTHVVPPEGTIAAGVPTAGYTKYSYDARGNVIEVRQVAKAGSGLADLVITSGFDVACLNQATCNKPNWTRDAKGNQTDYTYTSDGDPLTVVLPAAVAGGIRPTTRFRHNTRQAYYKDSSGSIVASGQQISLLTAVSVCQTSSSCADTSDEVRTSFDYGPLVPGTANNLLAISRTDGSGTGALSATTTSTYDAVGNLISVDGPLTGTDDTTYYEYDAVRRRIGTIGPDPDGGGPLKRRAQYVGYNNGVVTNIIEGTATGPSLATFVGSQDVSVSYDAYGRKQKEEFAGGYDTYSLMHYTYDSLGRVECVVQRMDPTIWFTQSANCLANSAGADGYDRITKYDYDAAGRVNRIRTGYGTSWVADEQRTTFTINGLVGTIKDANGNVTTLEYDGFDRLSKTRFPSPTAGAGTSSSTDYTEALYDPNGNVTQLRLRGYAADSFQRILFSYDNLDRMTAKVLPNGESDVTFSYDLLGRTTFVTKSGHQLGFTYDALGRNLTQTGPLGTTSYDYDLAGRRTQITWPGSPSLFVNYDYLASGALSKIRENGATSGIGVLAAYSYDSMGFRTGAIYGNGTSASYAADPIQRLSSMAIDLSGATGDLTVGFAYNSASQIKQRTRSNTAYTWDEGVNISRSYTTNGLNQYSAAGPESFTYDPRGNLATSGSKSYGYSSENYLTSGPGVTLGYDPLGRLYQTSGSTVTRFAYDGQNLIAEYDSSNNLLRRYVHGVGADEPVVWYEGAGVGNRRWLHADERGSVIAVTDSAGSSIGTNSYDEYGIPASGHLGRFQYTGQTWIPELGMYYYKARFYSPTLGRFMQTDPIGYADSLNLYGYVGNDPVNNRDPSGLCDDDNRAKTSFRRCEDDKDDEDDIVVTAWRSVPMGATSAPYVPKSGGRSSSSRRTAASSDFMRTLDSCPETSFFEFRNAANNAYATFPTSLAGYLFSSFTGRGLAIHAYFAARINAVGGTYRAEVSYKNGEIVPYGTKGSVRADGVFGPLASPSYVVELKSGMASVSVSELIKYRQNLPRGTRVCAITEALGAE